MPIVNTISSLGQFHDALGSRKNQFSVYAWECIYEYYDELSDDVGVNIEFDPIGFSCEFSEYDSIAAFLDDFTHALDEMSIVHINGVYVPENEYDEDCNALEYAEKYESGEYDEALLELIKDYLGKDTTVLNCDEDCILFTTF